MMTGTMASTMTRQQWLEQQLQAIQEQGLLRRNQTVFFKAAASRHSHCQLDFSSNDYLGLSNDPRLVQTMQSAVARYGIGSGGSPLICGYSEAHERLEKRICELTGRDRAILFSSGYLANLALISTFAAKRHDRLIMDKLNHASLIDAAQLVAAEFKRYKHLDMSGLQSLLERGAEQTLVVTEGVFSMSGAIADVSTVAALSARHGALMAVDDAHGFGVLGATGAGTVSAHKLTQQQVPLLLATLGKAAGVQGAFIAGPEDMIELLIQRGRSYIYSTALPAALATTAVKSLQLIEAEAWRREKLTQLVRLFRSGATERGLRLIDSPTAIQAYLLPGNERVLRAGRLLAEKGIRAGLIRAPTVAKNSERIRIILNAMHTEKEVTRLLDELFNIQNSAWVS